MSQKSYPFLYSEGPLQIEQDFLDSRYCTAFNKFSLVFFNGKNHFLRASVTKYIINIDTDEKCRSLLATDEEDEDDK